MTSLNSLLGTRYEDASFHDAELLSSTIDWESGTASFAFDIPYGSAESSGQSNYQRGTLTFAGLCFYLVEPALLDAAARARGSLWITAEGSLPDPQVAISAYLPPNLPAGALAYYLYASNTNSFIIVAATSASFTWGA
ncbi:hypothetical protein G4G28_13490 [Massilia sp. Dwa41.01b]|uniref:hypothetical protein n=1 Tax=unclassified Massilia TaxID=2609279 RepID=UPI001601B0F5|nr:MULTISPECIES: hypothetical protein [unclassified Massilia]QNA89227.1 hypothetical protein G4G28_13490 [Massilia sp. Dwa41.01b]QNB00131.1 hypothetical protein G4G31_17060 [Massilia sp. Se16.2.3]